MNVNIAVYTDQGRETMAFLESPGENTVVLFNPPIEQLMKESDNFIFIVYTEQEKPSGFFKSLRDYLDTHICILICSEDSFRSLSPTIRNRLFAHLTSFDETTILEIIHRASRVNNLFKQIRSFKHLLLQKEQELSAYKISNQALMNTSHIATALNALIQNVQYLIKSQLWLVYMYDDKTDNVHLEACCASGIDLDNIRHDVFLSRLAKHIVTENVELILPAFDSGTFSQSMGTCGITSIDNLVGLPIRSQQNTLGVLLIINMVEHKNLSQREKNLIYALADHISIVFENSLLYQQTQQLSIIDDLTQVYNFRFLSESLDHEIRRSDQRQLPVTMLFLDLNGFKEVNEQFGHLVGNKILKEIAGILKGSTRGTDIVARFGGDEFAIVLPETSSDNGYLVARRISRVLQSHHFTDLGQEYKITASIGIATYPEHVTSKNNIIKAADTAMYRAKELEEQIAFAEAHEEDSMS